eukprot:1865062-Amphidinium_carterae.1
MACRSSDFGEHTGHRLPARICLFTQDPCSGMKELRRNTTQCIKTGASCPVSRPIFRNPSLDGARSASAVARCVKHTEACGARPLPAYAMVLTTGEVPGAWEEIWYPRPRAPAQPLSKT